MTRQPLILGDRRWIAWRIERAQQSVGFKRYARRVDEIPMSTRERNIVLALLMVEMTARPRLARACEWVVWFAGRCFFVPARWLPLTRGPFQMKRAPFGFHAAATEAADRIRDQPDDPDSLARYWHGAACRERGARVGYGYALQIALRIVAARHNTPHELLGAMPDRGGGCLRRQMARRHESPLRLRDASPVSRRAMARPAR